MARHLEQEAPALPDIREKGDTSLDAPNNLANNKKLPYGVAPETYGLLLFARDRKDILDKVDSLDKGKNRIINPTRNLLGVYFGTEISIRELTKFVRGDRVTNSKRMLEALEVIWENVPPEIQLQYPKEKAVRLKESPEGSPQMLKKMSEAAKTLWENQNYRNKTTEALKRRKDKPEFITRMRQISRGRPPPMKGKKHAQETIAKIRATTQENWNKHHGIKSTEDPFAKRNALFTEWSRLVQLLRRSPSAKDITRLKKGGKTRFSTTMYNQEFGQGSFAKAKEILGLITSIQIFAADLLQNPSKISERPVLEKDIKTIYKIIMARLNSILSAPSIKEIQEEAQVLYSKIPEIKRQLNEKATRFSSRIGKDEKSIWSYAVEQNLLPKILQANMLTHQEIDLLRRYFEKGIIGEKLTEAAFNRFTMAVAKTS